MDAIDAALVGSGPAPLILRMFLLATGERGIGFKHVFGDRTITLHEFEVLSYCQQHVLQASTEEGRSELSLARGIRKAEELEESGALDQINREPPVDFERMTPEEFDAWMRRNNLAQ